MNKHRKQSKNSAFTIVELLIVVVVIAILAAITIVAYSGIQKQAVRASVQSALSTASTAMKVQAVQTQSYAKIPDNVKPADNVGLALTELPSPSSPDTSFCMNGTYMGHDDVAFHTTEAGDVEEGLCEGDVLPDTIVGEYNYSAGGGTAPEDLGYTPISIGESTADLYNFKVITNLEWTNVTLSWDSQPGAARYEVQTTTTSNETGWDYRRLEDGAGSSSYNSSTYSGQVPSSTTSLTWTDPIRSVPYSVGQTYRYRIRPCSGSSQSTCSGWTVATLVNPVQDTSRVPDIRGFTVTPAPDWSSVNISWNQAGDYSTNMGATRHEIQTSTVSTETGWDYRRLEDGAGSASHSSSGYSGQVPTATTSLTWTDPVRSVPRSVGQTYHYRIRNCANSSTGFCGNWSTVTLANPIQSSSSVPIVSGFTVTPAPDWSSVNISWNQAGDYSTNMAATRYEVQTTTVATENSWAYRLLTTGAGSSSYNSTTYSGQIPNATTSLNWSDTAYAVPSSVGQTYRYRIRNCASSTQSFCGPWETRSLSR